MRHSYSTLALDAGIDVKILSDRVGHANPNVTFPSTGHDRPTAEMLAALIESALLNTRRQDGERTRSGRCNVARLTSLGL